MVRIGGRLAQSGVGIHHGTTRWFNTPTATSLLFNEYVIISVDAAGGHSRIRPDVLDTIAGIRCKPLPCMDTVLIRHPIRGKPGKLVWNLVILIQILSVTRATLWRQACFA